ncbi:MAG: hypothetical protein JNL98_20850 [Bryobacterales bacterium]|nr:hypothetical protein [Bryobacterales bacterium]
MAQEPPILVQALTSVWGMFLTSGMVFYGTQKLCKQIEDALPDQTKLEIAVAIIGVDGSRTLEQADGFLKRAFDWLWTPDQYSMDCLARVALVTVVLINVYALLLLTWGEPLLYLLLGLPLALVSVFFSVAAMRHEFYSFRDKPGFLSSIEMLFRLIIGSAVAAGIPSAALFFPVLFIVSGYSESALRYGLGAAVMPFIVGLGLTMVAAILVTLYVAAFYLLRIAFLSNAMLLFAFKKLDIEKKPLQSLGLVMGLLLAIGVFSVNLGYQLVR